MKKYFLILILAFIQSSVLAQKNFLDQPYLETSAKKDTLVTPDRIYLSIQINEADSKNKKSVEQQEKELENALKKLNINIEKDLTLLDLSSNFKSYFLKGQNVIKSKQYELLVRDAITAGKVLVSLENIGISNVHITKTEFSKEETLLLELRVQAIAKTKEIANKLVKPLNQKVGKAIFISDRNDINNSYEYERSIASVALKSFQAEEAPINLEFKKIKIKVEVSVKYILE